jgi:hypothetical protein
MQHLACGPEQGDNAPQSRCWRVLQAMGVAAFLLTTSVISSNVSFGAQDEAESMNVASSASQVVQSSDGVRPIYYPHSPRSFRPNGNGSSDADRLLAEFLHLHTAMQYKDALAVIERLIELLPESAVMHYNRACVLGRLLRTEESLDALERAIELGWRNLSHLSIDPDLQAVRWNERFDELANRLAAKLRRERPASGPLRDEAWETIVGDIETVMPNFLANAGLSAMSVALVRAGEHVWTGTFIPEAGLNGNTGAVAHQRADDTRRYRVEGPVQLISMLGVLAQWPDEAEPGVVRLVEVFRHATRAEMASSHSAWPVGHPSRGSDDAGVFSAELRGAAARNRSLAGGRVLRISHVPDHVYDVLRLTVAYFSGDSFTEYCREQALPSMGMTKSEVVIVGGVSRGAYQAAFAPSVAEDLASDHRGWPGEQRIALETTADELASLITHVLAMERSPRKQMMDWQQISDFLLRSCVTRELSIGSGIIICRTPFGLRTDIVSTGGGSGCLMRWYPASGNGVVVLFDDEGRGTGRRAAERLVHLALGGEP